MALRKFVSDIYKLAVILKKPHKLRQTFYPRILFPTIYFIFTLSSFIMLFFVLNKIFISPKSNLKTEIYFPAILFILFIGYFSFHLLFFFCFYFKYITFNKNSISLF